MSLYLLRHGQTVCNAQGVVQGPRIDSELSELGREQAAALGDAFEHSQLDIVYASPMQRARDTASRVVDPHRGQVATRVVPELYEMDYGALCGQHLQQVQAEMDHIHDAWHMGFIHQAYPGGESPVLVQHRVRSFATVLLEQASEHEVVVVAHGHLNRVLLATVTQTPLAKLDQFQQANANITHLDVADGVSIRRLNDTAHLD